MEKNGTILQKLWIIIAFILVLWIPLGLIDDMVQNRASSKLHAIDDIAKIWAQAQTISRPELKLNGKTLRLADFKTTANLTTENYKKDIFKIPVYTASVKVEGTFLNDTQKDSLAELFFRATDNKGFISKPVMKIGANDSLGCLATSCIFALKNAPKVIPFEIEYKIKGTKKLSFEAGGETSILNVSSNWQSPEYIGDFLPVEKSSTFNVGSKAHWSVPSTALSAKSETPYGEGSLTYGLSFENPVDNYRLTERVVKYGLLFLCLTFLSFFVFEITSKKQNHPIQYSMVGAAIVVFYILLLSMSEFIPFWISYVMAAFMTISLIGLYTYFVLVKCEDKKFAILISGILTTLYSYLYITINLEKYALLFGSFGLFLTIVVIMYATRNVQWYKNEQG